jgi:hypothetical protein
MKEETMDIDYDDLCGVRELAERLQEAGYPFERTHISTWISRRDSYVNDRGQPNYRPNNFPTPVRELGMGGLYKWSEVLEWVESRYELVEDSKGVRPR